MKIISDFTYIVYIAFKADFCSLFAKKYQWYQLNILELRLTSVPYTHDIFGIIEKCKI